MAFTQQHSYNIAPANDGIGYLVLDETGSPWGQHETIELANCQIDFLTSGKCLEQRIADFEAAE
jgi:hypothetical protein